MSQPLRMQLLEVRRCKPIREILTELYAEHGTLQGVATDLRMTRQNLWLWMKMQTLTVEHLRLPCYRRNNGQTDNVKSPDV